MSRGIGWKAWSAAALFGVTFGVGAFTFGYAKGSSYLGHDPAACANCHIMREQYEGWLRSSHRAVAGCNDCHTPHAPVPKYATKAWNGLRHSWAFTTGWFHEPIRITSANRAITEGTCRDCHEPIVEALNAAGHAPSSSSGLSCVRCHNGVGHAELSPVATGAAPFPIAAHGGEP